MIRTCCAQFVLFVFFLIRTCGVLYDLVNELFAIRNAVISMVQTPNILKPLFQVGIWKLFRYQMFVHPIPAYYCAFRTKTKSEYSLQYFLPPKIHYSNSHSKMIQNYSKSFNSVNCYLTFKHFYFATIFVLY